MWSQCDLNFGLLISKSNPFIPVPNCIKVVNFGEIVRCRVHKLLVHAHAHTQSRTLDSPKTECLLRLIASGDVNIIQHVQSPNNSEDDEYAVVSIHRLSHGIGVQCTCKHSILLFPKISHAVTRHIMIIIKFFNEVVKCNWPIHK